MSFVLFSFIGLCGLFFLVFLLSGTSDSEEKMNLESIIPNEHFLASREKKDTAEKASLWKEINRLRKQLNASVEKNLPKEDPWKKVPGELDELMKGKTLDVEAQEQFGASMELFLHQYQLNDTQLLSTECVDVICRLSLLHDSVDAYTKYIKHQTFLSLVESSNYFDGRPQEGGTVKSVIWFGRGGYTLPFSEIYEREAN